VSLVCMSHVTRMNGSCHTYECVVATNPGATPKYGLTEPDMSHISFLPSTHILIAVYCAVRECIRGANRREGVLKMTYQSLHWSGSFPFIYIYIFRGSRVILLYLIGGGPCF